MRSKPVAESILTEVSRPQQALRSPTLVARRLTTWAWSGIYNQRVSIFLLLLYSALALGLLAPIASDAFVDAGDRHVHLAITVEARDALAEGQFPLRVMPSQNWGTRYPFFQFYGNLPHTISGLLYFATSLDPYQSTKVVIFASFVLGAWFTYCCSYVLFRNRVAGAVAGAVFMTAPYMLVDIFHRVAYPEFVAFNILPVVFFYTLRAFSTRKISPIINGGLAWAAMFLTHNIFTVWSTVFIGLFFLSLATFTRTYLVRIVRVGVGYILGVALSIWYLAPQLRVVPLLNLQSSLAVLAWSISLVHITTLLAPIQISPLETVPSIEHIGLQVGWTILIPVGLAICYLRLRRGQRTIMDTFALRLIIWFGLAFFIVWSPVNFWPYVPKTLAYTQFTYRILVYTTFSGALLAAFALARSFPRALTPIHAAVCILLVSLAAGSYLPSPRPSAKTLDDIIASPYLNGADNDYKLSNAATKLNNLSTEGQNVIDATKVISSTTYGLTTVTDIQVPQPSMVQLPVSYYPDLLQVQVDGQTRPYQHLDEFVALSLEPGQHHITVQFIGLTWANWISLISWIGVGLGICILAGLATQRYLRSTVLQRYSQNARSRLSLLGWVPIVVVVAVLYSTTHAWWQRTHTAPEAQQRFPAISIISTKAAFFTLTPDVNEPLISWGKSPVAQILFVHYAPNNQVQFGIYDHAGLSDPLTIVPSQFYDVKLVLNGMQNKVDVIVNGQSVYQPTFELVQYTPSEFFIGRNPNPTVFPSVPSVFSGSISGTMTTSVPQTKTINVSPSQPIAELKPTWVMNVTFGPQNSDKALPLVTTGTTGFGDFINMRILEDGRVQFMYDHWGFPTVVGQPLALDLKHPHTIEVHMDPIERGILCRVDGQLAVQADSTSFDFSSEQVTLGANTIGGGTTAPLFSGTLTQITLDGEKPIISNGKIVQ